MTSSRVLRQTFGLNTLYGVIVGAALLFAACANPVSPPSNAGTAPGTGQVQVTITGEGFTPSASARTVYPAIPTAADHYEYTFSKVGTSDVVGPDTIAYADRNDAITLETGDWTVAVEAYATSATNSLIATGASAQFTVAQDTLTANVPVTLNKVADEGTGTLTYTINHPAGASVTAITWGAVGVAGTPESPYGTSGATITKTPVNAGYYLISATLTETATGKTAGKSEVVHIYKNLTTDVAWTFDTADFTKPTLLPNGQYTVRNAGAAPTDDNYINLSGDTNTIQVRVNGGDVTFTSADDGFTNWKALLTELEQSDTFTVAGNKITVIVNSGTADNLSSAGIGSLFADTLTLGNSTNTSLQIGNYTGALTIIVGYSSSAVTVGAITGPLSIGDGYNTCSGIITTGAVSGGITFNANALKDGNSITGATAFNALKLESGELVSHGGAAAGSGTAITGATSVTAKRSANSLGVNEIKDLLALAPTAEVTLTGATPALGITIIAANKTLIIGDTSHDVIGTVSSSPLTIQPSGTLKIAGTGSRVNSASNGVYFGPGTYRNTSSYTSGTDNVQLNQTGIVSIRAHAKAELTEGAVIHVGANITLGMGTYENAASGSNGSKFTASDGILTLDTGTYLTLTDGAVLTLPSAAHTGAGRLISLTPNSIIYNGSPYHTSSTGVVGTALGSSGGSASEMIAD
jgi:hypothetical protein